MNLVTKAAAAGLDELRESLREARLCSAWSCPREADVMIHGRPLCAHCARYDQRERRAEENAGTPPAARPDERAPESVPLLDAAREVLAAARRLDVAVGKRDLADAEMRQRAKEFGETLIAAKRAAVDAMR